MEIHLPYHSQINNSFPCMELIKLTFVELYTVLTLTQKDIKQFIGKAPNTIFV